MIGYEEHEQKLVIHAAAGNGDAFTELFNRYYPMIHAFAFRNMLESSDAEDIAQETFIKAARSIGGFRGDSSFKNWLYRIALNLCRDLSYKRQNRESLASPYRAKPHWGTHPAKPQWGDLR
jgi:RNA polymerase sigma-70 factor (ECF subfamily)